jgi:glycosyltransferase involved in cell wall biosynthesis
VKVLFVSFYFPPAGGGGVQRLLRFSALLPELGFEVHVLAPDDPRWIHRDPGLRPPAEVVVHRARYLGPRGRLPAEELYGRRGLDRFGRRLLLLPRRLLLPDENVSWLLTAVPTAVRLVRRERIDLVVTSSPPGSVHLLGAAVRRATGVRWVADLRDSLVGNPDRRLERLAVRAKEVGHQFVAERVASSADAIVTVTGAISEEMSRLGPRGTVAVIANGCDFDEFEGITYQPGERFRITHTGSFFGGRSPRPFMNALADSGLDLVARFAGGFRQADRELAERLELGDRLELYPSLPHRQVLELQRNSEALLLLLPELGGRGREIPSGKIYEYIAAGRPILAAVPSDGAAADLIRETESGLVVSPDDQDGLAAALSELVERWQQGRLNPVSLEPAARARLSRQSRAEELALLLQELQ